MLIRNKPNWEIPEAQATPETVYFNRRRFMSGAGAVGLSGVLVGLGSGSAQAQGRRRRRRRKSELDPTHDLYPVDRNEAYELDRGVTTERHATSLNNYYEFESLTALFISQRIAKEARRLKLRPWEIRIDGMVEKPFTIGFDDLARMMPLEERLYRHRCVETWAMAVPWSGFPMKSLVELAKPLSRAKYVRMETFNNPKVAPGQKRSSFYRTWPYVEGLTIAEATNELAFMVTGMYGRPVPKQNGAPLRLAIPWKYGFKSIKALVRLTFTDKQPLSFWQQNQSKEYGFWANVNPDVPHPRWSQATEWMLGTKERFETRMFNGYGEHVAHLYNGIDPKILYF